jgi:glutamate/tyrosine decarboxylase-like PLP-dependent enzyme
MTADRAALLDRIRQLEDASRPLEPGAAERQALLDATVASAERFLVGLDHINSFETAGDLARGLLAAPIAEEGVPLERVIGMLDHDVALPGGNPAAAGHLAYIPGGGLYHSALGDFWAAVTNKYAGLFFTGPGPVRMENLLLRWVADLVGYPETAGGNIASGGSIATLSAVVTARDAHGLKGADFATAAVYLTAEAHHCVEKALRIAGLGEAQVRHVAMDAEYRMRPDALAAAIAADRARGLRPWLIVATAGTTDAGAIDPLDAIADIAERERCWYHVDAAYGGFFLMTAHGRRVLRGIERSDSAILDPHKSLFLPWGSGIVVVRDVRQLAASHYYSANYMQDAHNAPAEISPCDVSPELSKPFRALRMWLPLILLGTRPFEAALDEKLLLARYFYEEVQTLGFAPGPPPELASVTFRWAPPGTSPEEQDRLNQTIVDGVRHDGRVFLSSTLLDGRFTLRLVSLGFRTHKDTIDTALQVLREQVERVR